jgi:hypothetical protein
MTEKLTIPLLVRLMPGDQAHLEELAKISECTVPQLARYYIRKAIHEQLKTLPPK